MTSRLRQAFTLVELLVVIAILAILAAILFPVFAKVKAKAKQSACLSNIKQISAAIMLYASDHDDCLLWLPNLARYVAVQTPPPTSTPNLYGPPYPSIDEVLQPYIKNSDVFFCPAMNPNDKCRPNGNPAENIITFRENGGTYVWNYRTPPAAGGITISGMPISSIPRPAEGSLVWDLRLWRPQNPWNIPAAHFGGGNVTWADGHAKWVEMVSGASTPGNGTYWADKSWQGFYP